MKNKAKKVIRKYYEYIVTKISILWAQRSFHTDDVRVKYILKKKKDSKSLVIVLSSCTRRGLKARYNYMRTLKKIPCNRLFILDDYAADHRGSYYLGKDYTFSEEKAVHQLIVTMQNKLDVKTLLFCGSSKGGYSALNFGLEYPGAYVLAGAPQYFLADYLVGSGNVEAYRHIIGDEDEEKKTALNYRLRNKINDLKVFPKPKIYLHYSDREHTFEEHVRHILEDLQENGYTVISDVADYTNHSDISYYFPDFLVKTINLILEESK